MTPGVLQACIEVECQRHGFDQSGSPALALYNQWCECVETWGADSPAALGCLLALVDGAGYNEAHLTAWRDNDGRIMWGVLYRPDPVNIPATWLSAVEDGSPTKAEALVEALESAP